ncbi:hypothetical protein AGABI2DRAFT_179014 [Agaricus bisporus var. bisporus H97]|uniref:hypothetical protein n=1 Tax=Agaricus bisporus var. bisporus (strain H97 / ATCC MYA-4626 / FGSC 10389) TaxID=936046 RepID=UPI00029F7C8C|nr:hypothetical protein AGABI2DRAFT_179014 [Agaricus bisporus var. bisporus H97]EKV46815.1 hypothetical protein AGABI2DRAFT_179014 [Agaricus bisporus var. bisporus H97]
MVAARKTPSAPAPPTSRTHSTQALPRAVGAKLSHSNLGAISSSLNPAQSKAEPNGVAKSSSKKSKSRKLPQAQRKKRSPLDRLFILILSTFVAYVLYNCPSDSNLNNPVCRSLANYRTHVLEPFIMPPIRAAVTHPTVVEPFEKYAKPMYQSYIEPITPYVAAANRRAAPYINKAVSTSARTSQRVWNNVIKVYWMRAVVPQYQYRVQPLVNKYVSPITKRVNPYVQNLSRQASIYARRTQERAQVVYDFVQPYVATTYAFAKPRVIRGYAFAKPYSLRAAGVVQTQGKSLASGTMFFVRSALGRMGDLRRQFVDPHVLRIWEKAVEKSGHSATPSTTATQSKLSFAAESSATNLPVTSEVPVEENAMHAATPALVETLEKAASVAEQSAGHASEVIDELEREVHLTEAAQPTLAETFESAASIAEQSAGHASKVIDELERDVYMTEAAQAVLTAAPQAEMTPEPTPSDYPEAKQDSPSETPASDHATTDNHPPPVVEDLDDFLKEIGFNEEETASDPETTTDSEPTPEVDQEARKAATALKRTKIVDRHMRWQSQLEELAKDAETRLKIELSAIREAATAAIGLLPSPTDNTSSDGKGQEAIEKVQSEGEKLLKGLEAYINKLMSREIKPEDREKEQESYDKIVDKVKAKFRDTVRNVQEDVHNWFVSVRDKETEAVLTAGRELKSLAEDAQADLGLDYAWLDDVTYEDWQKYHDLMRNYERFDQLAHSLQNGTHPEAPEDRLIPALNDLDNEVQSMIGGFAMRMSVLVRNGERWLAGLQPLAEPDIEDEKAAEEASKDMNEPQVSILPISSEGSGKDLRPEDVIIGKLPEQIEKMGQQAQRVLEKTEL